MITAIITLIIIVVLVIISPIVFGIAYLIWENKTKFSEDNSFEADDLTNGSVEFTAEIISCSYELTLESLKISEKCNCIKEVNDKSDYPELEKVLEDIKHSPQNIWMVTLTSANNIFVLQEEKNIWLNVYARGKLSGEKISEASGEWEQYGWNLDEKRWSYGSGPAGSRELTPIMRNDFISDISEKQILNQ